MSTEEKNTKKEEVKDETPRCEKCQSPLLKSSKSDKLVCKVCCFESKEDLQFIVDNYEFIEGIAGNKSSELKIEEDETYALLNDIYREKFNDMGNKTKALFSNINTNRDKIVNNSQNAITNKYQSITEAFENTVKEVNAAITSLDKTKKGEFALIKKKLDDITTLVDSKEKINEEFDKIIATIEKRITNISTKRLVDTNLKFECKYGKGGGNLLWKHNNDSLLTVMAGGNSYKCYTTEDVFDGVVTARVKIIDLNGGYVGSSWNMSFGLIRETYNESSYYESSCLLQSYGHLNNKFSGGSNNTKKSAVWANGDELYVRRDEENNIWFANNQEEPFVAFKNITGRMRVVLGFATSYQGQKFELEECGAW